MRLVVMVSPSSKKHAVGEINTIGMKHPSFRNVMKSKENFSRVKQKYSVLVQIKVLILMVTTSSHISL